MFSLFTSLSLGLAVGYGLGASIVRREWAGIIIGAVAFGALIAKLVSALGAM